MASALMRQLSDQGQQQGFTAVNKNTKFSDGVMLVGGVPQRPATVRRWESSNGLTVYTTVEWIDPSTGERRTSCNCPGWANARSNVRECTHTKQLEGRGSCDRKLVTDETIRTVAQAKELIPEIIDGRELRGIML